MDTPERLPRLCASSKAWPEARSDTMGVRDLFGSTLHARRTERGVQTCGKNDSLLSTLQHRRVTRLQEQVERLQQRVVELEDDQSQARKQFQDRLQQVHENWQDCFERHQRSWANNRAEAEGVWDKKRQALVAQIAHLCQVIDHGADTEDAAVQAGVASSGNKSRSSQTPRPHPHPGSHASSSWDLSRTQSLPQDHSIDWAQEASNWVDAPLKSSSLELDFGSAVAAYAVKAGSLTGEQQQHAARKFAAAAATYTHDIVESILDLDPTALDTSRASLTAAPALLNWSPAPAPVPACWTSFNSCSSESSFGSDQSAADNCFLPLEEEEELPLEEAEDWPVEEEGTVQPLPDQAWWEEFGEYESAPHTELEKPFTDPKSPDTQPGKPYLQPRLVMDNDIIRRPVFTSFPQNSSFSNRAPPSGAFWSTADSADAVSTHPKVPRLDLSQLVQPHTTRWSLARDHAQEVADDDDIWRSLDQQADGLAAKPTCTAFELSIQEPEEDCTVEWTRHARFPTPSSNPRGLQEAPFPLLDLCLLTTQAANPKRVSTPNMWGLQETALPLIEISQPPGGQEAYVIYTPIEDLLTDDTSPHPATPKQHYSFPVSFHDDTMEEATVEVMDMSVGDLVSVGGPDLCSWDGTSSSAQHSMPNCFSTGLNFAANALASESFAEHYHTDTAEQAVQTEATQTEQSMQSTRSTLRTASSTRSMATQAAVEAAAERLLPLNCRVAARVSTKLPPLDHEPQLPPLPENFILPPEMHPVPGKYTYHSTQTSPTGSPNADKKAAVGLLADGMAIASGSATGTSGKWLHHKRAPPQTAAQSSGDVLSEAAARAGQSVQAFLAPTQVNSIVRDMLECTIDNSTYLPFTNRLCDSGFMTCQLAQLLAPIRSASAPLASIASEAATEAAGVGPTEAVDAVEQETAEFKAAAAAVADAEAEEAAIDAVTDALLAQLGLIASEHASANSDLASGVELASDAESDFEYISDGECEEPASRKRSARDDWTQAVLTKQPKADRTAMAAASQAAVIDSSAAGSASDAKPGAAAESSEDVSGSVVSLTDVVLEVEGDETHAPAVCFAAAESAGSDAESSFASVASSIASFKDYEALDDTQRQPSGDWEML